MNAGVSTIPWGVVTAPRRAPAERAFVENEKIDL